MPIIDSQIHPYEANTPKRPWVGTPPNWPPSANADENVAAMDKLGIDGAILISSFSMYRYDASYAVEAQKAHPDRFALVKPLDVDDAFEWYCPKCWTRVHRVEVNVQNIVTDLPPLFEQFYSGKRQCPSCGHIHPGKG